MPPADDAAPRVPLGPVGRYVIENLKQLRDARRLTYRQLADRLKELGRPIPTLGLSRIEKGDRRVDADDLVALAMALGVNPAALLLPRDTDPFGEIKLAAEVRATAKAAWEWSSGNLPLVASGRDALTWREIEDFETHSRPEWLGRGLSEWREQMERRRAEMEEYRRKAEAAEEALRAEIARNGHAQEEQVQPREMEGVRWSGPAAPLRPEPQTVVAGVVTSDRGVLVTRRVDQNPPWGFTAGWGEPGESPEDTIVREVKEEADLRVEAGEYLGERDHPDTGKHMIYYAARPTHGTEIHLGDKGELTEVRWVSLAEADELLPGMFGPVREHLARELGEG